MALLYIEEDLKGPGSIEILLKDLPPIDVILMVLLSVEAF